MVIVGMFLAGFKELIAQTTLKGLCGANDFVRSPYSQTLPFYFPVSGRMMVDAFL